MKPYPINKYITITGDSMSSTYEFELPTKEALNNFEQYLDASELKFYNNLDDLTKTDLLSRADPFIALEELMHGNERKSQIYVV